MASPSSSGEMVRRGAAAEEVEAIVEEVRVRGVEKRGGERRGRSTGRRAARGRGPPRSTSENTRRSSQEDRTARELGSRDSRRTRTEARQGRVEQQDPEDGDSAQASNRRAGVPIGARIGEAQYGNPIPQNGYMASTSGYGYAKDPLSTRRQESRSLRITRSLIRQIRRSLSKGSRKHAAPRARDRVPFGLGEACTVPRRRVPGASRSLSRD